MTFSLARVGVRLCYDYVLRISRLTYLQDRPVAELVAATGSGGMGGFTLFQVRGAF